MSTDISTNNLQINILSKEQYESIEPNNNELYFVEDVRNVLLVGVSDTAPTTANEGDKYYSTTDKLIYTYSMNGWYDGETPDKDILYIHTESKYSYVWDGSSLISVGGFSGYDNETITLNDEGKIQAFGTVNQKDNSLKYDWVGTKEEYDALTEHNDNWIYYIVDDNVSANMSLSNVLNRLNKAYAWVNDDIIVYTIPLPEVGYTIYSDMNMGVVGIIDSMTDISITCNSVTYMRDESFDNVFNGVSNDSQKQIITMYDLIKAFKGI